MSSARLLLARPPNDLAGLRIGRPYLWGLASGGEKGVRHVLALLAAELRLAMGLTGRPTLADVDATLLGR
jgi:4-hydroxymandelate oxidase